MIITAYRMIARKEYYITKLIDNKARFQVYNVPAITFDYSNKLVSLRSFHLTQKIK